MFALVAEANPEAIHVNETLSEAHSQIGFGDQHTATSLYFSFVTLTTLGYGDITPLSMPARMLVVAEAVIGQIYLVVLVARLVGLQISNESHTDER